MGSDASGKDLVDLLGHIGEKDLMPALPADPRRNPFD